MPPLVATAAPECCRGEDGTAIGLVEVRSHSGDVAHIVAHVVGDGRRVARVVFRDIGFDFSDQVRPDIGGFGIDTAPDAGKESLRGSAHAERDHGGRDVDQLLHVRRAGSDQLHAKHVQSALHVRRGVHELVEHDIPDANVEKTEADDNEAHDGAGSKGDLQASIEPFAATLGSSGRCCGGCPHPDVTAKAAKEPPRKEGHGHKRILDSLLGQKEEDAQKDEKDHGDDHVLPSQVSHGSFSHIARDFDHPVRALTCFGHLLVEEHGEAECEDGSDGGDPPHISNHGHGFLLG